MINIPSKSQAWSIDIILGVILFMAAFLIFYMLLNVNQNTKLAQLKEEAAIVAKQITAEYSIVGIVNDAELNETKMVKLKNTSYQDLKRILKIEGDFCIFLEDDKGNVVLINQSFRGIGAPNINISKTPCSQK